MGTADALGGALDGRDAPARPTADDVVRPMILKLLLRDCKSRGGAMPRYGFLPSLLWDMLAAEMTADGKAFVPAVLAPNIFPAIMIADVPLYADDCEGCVRFGKSEADVKRYAWTAIYAFATSSNVGRAPEDAAAGDPLGVSGPKESVG